MAAWLYAQVCSSAGLAFAETAQGAPTCSAVPTQTVGYAPDCASAFTPQLTNAWHYDVLARVFNENSYGLGASNLLQEDLYIVSVLQNRATTPGAGNLNNGQNSRSIDNQAKYAGNPSSTSFGYPNLSNLIQAKTNLSLDLRAAKAFLRTYRQHNSPYNR